MCALSAALLAGLVGCAPRNSMLVRQDSAPPSQQRIKLASDWGYYDLSEGRLNCLLAFPLPASRAGPRDFLLYLSLPEAEGQHAVDPSADSAARGFFIQQKGLLRGIAYLSGGRATVRGVWLQPGRKRIDLELECDDATLLNGSATLEAAPSELEAFGRRYVHDIARLIPSTQPSTAPGPGEPRRGQGG
jgi:hypothetical protein